MKRTLLATTIGLTFIAASIQPTLAQDPYGQESGGGSPQYGQQPDQGAENGGEDEWQDHGLRHAHPGGYSQNEQNEAPGGGPGPHAGAAPPPHGPPPPPNAARFVFQRGSARIDVTCPQAFGLRDCIQAASELLDKIHSLGSGAHRPDAENGAGGGNNNSAPGGGTGQQPAPGGSTPQATPPDRGGDRM